MGKIVTSYANFAKAKLDHDMGGRFDLPIYGSGADVFQNFISNYKGNAIYSAGFLSQIAFQDCAFVEFKFGITQNYLCVFYASKIRFAAFDTNGVFGWVLSGGLPLEVTSPYTLADAKYISKHNSYSQNSDVMVIVHRSYEPMKLTRTASNAFTLAVFSRKTDPFPLTWQATKAVTGITNANPAVFTVVGHGYTTGDRALVAGVTGMTQINGYTVAITVLTANTFSVDVDTTTFTAYAANGTTAKVLTGSYPGCVLFYKGRLFYASTPAKPTTVWFSNSGLYDDYTIQSPLTDASGFNFGIADISQQIEWLYPADNSLVAGATDGIVAINGGSVNTAITPATVQANITSAEPTNGVYPIKKEGLVFYIGQNNRNMYYFQYDILTQAFLAKDANISSFDITKGNLLKIRFKKDRNDLIFNLRGDGALASTNFKASENIIGWHERFSALSTTLIPTAGFISDISVIGDNLGNPQLFILVLRNGTYYIEQQAPYIEFTKRDNFYTGSSPDQQTDDDEAYNRFVAEQLRGCVFVDNALTYSDYRTSTITYNAGAGTITSGAADFAVGDIGKHIVYKTSTGYESGRFLIVGYTSATVVTVTVLQTPKQVAGAALNVWSSWYKSFLTVSGIGQYNGQTVGVITDGGYLADYLISGGTITFPQQTTNMVIGYRYIGVIKTFCLGFVFQGQNTQTTLKNIVRVGVRAVGSAGLKVGASRYALEPVQERTPNDINYLPPLPIDGVTKYVDYVDDAQEDKFLYIVQEEPLPAQVTNIALEANYALTS